MGWIGVDFDRSLATYEHKQWPALGQPIPAMVERVKGWLAEGREVRIVTARVCGLQDPFEQINQDHMIKQWCIEHIGQSLPVTSEKDYRMTVLYDDRAVQVVPNTGQLIGEEFNLRDEAS